MTYKNVWNSQVMQETLVEVVAGVPFIVLGVDSKDNALDGVSLRVKGSGEVESPLP